MDNELKRLRDEIEKCGLNRNILKAVDLESIHKIPRRYNKMNENELNNLSDKELIKLAKITENPEILETLSNGSHDIRLAVASNENTPVEILEKLSEDNFYIREVVAQNENTPVEILEKIAEEITSSSSLDKAIIFRADSDSEEFKNLVDKLVDRNIEDTSVLERVAQHENISPETFEKIYDQAEKTENELIKGILAENENTPTEILNELKLEKAVDAVVDLSEQRNIEERGIQVIESDTMKMTIDSSETDAFIKNSNINEDIRVIDEFVSKANPEELEKFSEKISDIKDVDDIKEKVAKKEYRNTPEAREEQVEKLVNSDDAIERGYIASDKNLSSEQIEKLSNDEDPYVREKVAQSGNATVEILERLSTDEDRNVRETAEYAILSIAQNENTSSETLDKIISSDSLEDNVKLNAIENENSCYFSNEELKDELKDQLTDKFRDEFEGINLNSSNVEEAINNTIDYTVMDNLDNVKEVEVYGETFYKSTEGLDLSDLAKKEIDKFDKSSMQETMVLDAAEYSKAEFDGGAMTLNEDYSSLENFKSQSEEGLNLEFSHKDTYYEMGPELTAVTKDGETQMVDTKEAMKELLKENLSERILENEIKSLSPVPIDSFKEAVAEVKSENDFDQKNLSDTEKQTLNDFKEQSSEGLNAEFKVNDKSYEMGPELTAITKDGDTQMVDTQEAVKDLLKEGVSKEDLREIAMELTPQAHEKLNAAEKALSSEHPGLDQST